MKVVVQEIEENKEGLEGLMGKRITLFCCRYIYTGDLVGVSSDSVKLSNGGIVYETGELKDSNWSDYQEMPNDWYVKIDSIESYGVLK